ncbi:hypothetical protein D3C79_911500 [compost metagenome]
MVSGLVPEYRQVAEQAAQQQGTLQAPQQFVEGQQVHCQAGDDHQRDVQAHQLARDPQRNDQRGQAQGYQDVEDVAADHAADGDIRRAGVGRLQADGQLRCAAAECHQAQADDQWSDLQAGGQAQGGAYQQFGAGDQQQQADAQLQQAESR